MIYKSITAITGHKKEGRRQNCILMVDKFKIMDIIIT